MLTSVELQHAIIGNASDDEILAVLLSHTDDTGEGTSIYTIVSYILASGNLEDFLHSFSLTGDDSLTATTLLSKEQIEKLRILFSLYDNDNTQRISKASVKKFLERAFQEQKSEEVFECC
jgi:hypothetical protein